jgi:hypothetical protein
MISRHGLLLLALALIVPGFGSETKAATFVIGAQGMVSKNGVSVDPGSDINGATSFTFTNILVDSGTNQGAYDSVVLSDILMGSSVLDVTANSFSFSNAAFGSYTATSVEELAESNSSRSFLIKGQFTPGALFLAANSDYVATPTRIVVAFSQIIDNNEQIITAAFTMASESNLGPDGVVPEPSSIAMTLTAGLAGLALAARKLRRRA